MKNSSRLNDERPLVTFALFAYNQEQYIREAIEGAFSQTYEPLEIILSDDKSSDRTFEIMQEMAEKYKGPHKVVIRQSEVNFGTALHVQAVANLSKGKLIVIAAGDDISESDRCKEIVDLWLLKEKPIACIHSAITYFGESLEKSFIRSPRHESITDQDRSLRYLKNDEIPFFSATCAYSIELFQNYKSFMGGSIIEDGIMSVRSLLVSQILSINKPLVRQRKVLESGGTGYKFSNPERWNRYIVSRIISSINQARDISQSNIDINLKHNLENYYLHKAFKTSKFIISFSDKDTTFRKFVFFISYIFFFPTKIGFLKRLISAIHLVNYNETKIYKSIYKFLKK